MITRYIKGNILDTELSNIAHGVNCQNVMGSGVAKVLADKWPGVKEGYHDLFKFQAIPGEDILGTVAQIEIIDDNKTVWNCFTQLHYLPRNKRNVNYRAIVCCFMQLVELGVEEIAIPKIGCGLAGGDWNIVEQLINDTVGNYIEIWVYEL